MMFMTAGIQNKREAERNGTDPDDIAQNSFCYHLYEELKVNSMVIFFLNKYFLLQKQS